MAKRAKRSINNPANPVDPWQPPEPNSISVTRETSLAISAVYRAVNLIASYVAKLPLNVYRVGDSGRERDDSHPASSLLRYTPNADMTAFVFWQTIMSHVLLDGNGFAFVERTTDGTPVSLNLLRPDRFTPVRLEKDAPVVYVDSERKRYVAAVDMLHIRGLGFDGLLGCSVVRHARESFGLAIGQQRTAANLFQNGMRPDYAIKHPGALSDKARANIMNSLAARHLGARNAWKPYLLEEGMDIMPLSFNAEDSQFLQSREFSVRDIANWFGLPPHKLGDSSRVSYNSLEQENQSFLDDSLDPWLVTIEQEARAKLLTDAERSNQFAIEFNRQALVRADLPTRFGVYATAIDKGIMSVNEVRRRENLNDIPNGDFPAADDTVESPPAGDLAARAEAVVRQCARRAARRLWKAKRGDETCAEFVDRHREAVTGILEGIVSSGEVDHIIATVFAADDAKAAIDAVESGTLAIWSHVVEIA